eukprot:TRINITY_DN70334_c0_g1_i1.p1 TRINITY_DN70334_c0_g1~~TRINITY_DN70334_c0_g1_i1.p1  ORF type:complete len:400 (+),score=98.18 TRINITY_DN70334_c0_g1_i1:97-1296(+)
MALRALPFRRSRQLLGSLHVNVDSFRSQDLKVTLDKNAAPPLKASELPGFGQAFTPHMLIADWCSDEGWSAPRIVPFGNLSLHPASSSLHYAIQCFEGMKAYTGKDGEVRLFRPDRNALRQLTSARTISLPSFDPAEWLKCVEALVDVERAYVPPDRGFSLYIRPTMISSDRFLGVAAPKRAMFYAICSPTGPYWASGLKPISLYADPVHRRAWPGGSGAFKVGANYGPTIVHQTTVVSRGCSQVLWLNDREELGEVGAMNLLGVFRTGSGPQVVTAPLDGTILPGVTRDSVLRLLNDRDLGDSFNEYAIEERAWTMKEVAAASASGELLEVFGVGTAAIVTPVKGIVWGDHTVDVPVPENSLAQALMKKLLDIQHGEEESEWSVVVPKGCAAQYSASV